MSVEKSSQNPISWQSASDRLISRISAAPRSCATSAIVLVSCLLLWDWQFGFGVYALTAFFGFHALIFLAFISLGPKGSLDFSKAEKERRQSKSPFDETLVRKHLDLFLRALFYTWVLLLFTILIYREDLFFLQDAYRPLIDIAASIMPAVRDMPDDMLSEGFEARFAVTQAAAAIGYNTGLIVLFYTIYVFVFLRAKIRVRPLWQHVVFLVASPVTFLVLSLVTVAMLSDTGVHLIYKHDRYFFENFESSDLSLLFRMLLWPTTVFFFLGMVWGLATINFIDAFRRVTHVCSNAFRSFLRS